MVGQVGGTEECVLPPTPPLTSTTLINHAWAKPQSAAGQLAGDTCFGPILSFHRPKLREVKGA